MKKLLLSSLLLLSAATIQARTWHVSPDGSASNDGSAKSPFRTISKAAMQAIAGDTILIYGGVYRERVDPANGGLSKDMPIVYMAAPGEKVEVKGSEQVSGWRKMSKSKSVWFTEVDNSIFGEFNPFDIKLFGDWLHKGNELHLGDVYLDGETLTEVVELDSLSSKANSWYAEVGNQKTTIYANFEGVNPNKSLTEINVRPTCFFPTRNGVNYITVKDISFSQGASQWSPPTAEQIGLIGPNWSKGWVIEGCRVFQSKSVGICIGKDSASGQNFSSLYKGKFWYDKMGFTREIESIFKAYDLGWSRENIGSHRIVGNIIHDCYQAGVVGHLGCAFSVIKDNEIYNIGVNPQIAGFETAGIKLHAAIDSEVDHNLIYNTLMGIWMDWQAQGAKVCNNIIFDSIQQDLYVEVSHGPTLIYNNIFLSGLSLKLQAQGIAFFNNIFNGNVQSNRSPERYTPYHIPHSTKIVGLFNNTGGDVRFYNNLVLQNVTPEDKEANGFSDMNNLPACTPETSAAVADYSVRFTCSLPMWSESNAYFNSAAMWEHDKGSVQSGDKVDISFERDGDEGYINLNINPSQIAEIKTLGINTSMLGRTITSEALFENPDETPFIFTTDIFGNERDVESPTVGATESFGRVRVW
ncbi:MAG: right-handed parallel beta-helix repeat-containing protein [Rikenellaceae bacterium]